MVCDCPQVAPETSGDLFDGTKIDEILTLRILTLTEGEKAAMRRSDDHARRLLDRASSRSVEHDYEGKLRLAVILDDNPVRLRQPRSRFFFTPEEVEQLP